MREDDDMVDTEAADFFARLHEVAGTPALDAVEVEEVLLLAKVVARGQQRRFAPLAAYAAGLAIGAATGAEDRAQRIRDLIDTVRTLEPDDA